MKPRALAGAALATVLLAGAAWWLLDRPVASDGAAGSLLLPGLGARLEQIDRLEVRGAGDQVLVEIEKHEGRWRMPSRHGWPANQREVGRALFRLSQARRLEAKTARPERHARLGVEAVSAADAKGGELRLSGGGEPLRLVIGNNHPSLGGSYVRLGDEDQAWLLDADVAPARDPTDWLDRRLLDLPLARIAQVRVSPAKGRAFRLSRDAGDRFGLDGKPAAALGNPDDGTATAAVVEQLALEDVAADSGTPATQTVEFEAEDGVRVTIAAWRQDDGTWARLQVALDEARATAWLARTAPAGEEGSDTAGTPTEAKIEGSTGAQIEASTEAPTADGRLQALRTQVAGWQERFEGRQFRLPAQKAANLMKSRDDYLAGT